MIKKVCLISSFSHLVSLIHEYNVYLSNFNNKFGLFCDVDFLFTVKDIIFDEQKSYDYDYYRYFIDRDIEIIQNLVITKKLVSNKFLGGGFIV